MNFQERFKGKTSTISKDGIQSVVLSSTNPIKKILGPSTSSGQVVQHQSTVSLDNSPKTNKRTPLSLTSSSQMQASGASSLMMISDAQSPKMNTYTPSNQISLFTNIQNRVEQKKSLQHGNSSIISLRSEDSPVNKRERPLVRKETGGHTAKSVNGRQFSSDSLMQDQGPLDFNPNNFYNQHSQARTPLRSHTEALVLPGVDLKASRNQYHKKNFESLSSQNKTKQISRDVFKDLYNPGYSHHSMQVEPRVLATEKTPRMYENAPHHGSYTPVNGLSGSGRHMLMDGYNREMSFASSVEHTPSGTVRRPYRASPDMRKMDGRGPVYTQEQDEWTDRNNVLRFSQLPETVRISNINNASANANSLYLTKPRSEGSPIKLHHKASIKLMGMEPK